MTQFLTSFSMLNTFILHLCTNSSGTEDNSFQLKLFCHQKLLKFLPFSFCILSAVPSCYTHCNLNYS